MEAHTARTCRVTHGHYGRREGREGVGSWEREEENILDIPTCCGGLGGATAGSPLVFIVKPFGLWEELSQELPVTPPPCTFCLRVWLCGLWPHPYPPPSPIRSGFQTVAQGPGRGHGHLVSRARDRLTF